MPDEHFPFSYWTPEELQTLRDLRRGFATFREIAHALTRDFGLRKYTVDSVKHKWGRTNWVAFRNHEDHSIERPDEREAEKEKVIERTLANNQRMIRREKARTDVIIDNIKSAIFRLPKPKPSDIIYTPTKSQGKRYAAEHVGVMVSDMHIGAAYTREETGGLSQYNLTIFKRRLQKMKLALLEIVERHRGMYDLPELHIFSLGDIIAGEPGAGQWNDNYIHLDVMEQVIEGVNALRDLVATWASAFKKVTFYGIYGNHGRVGKKGQTKSSDNWDRFCYAMLQVASSNYDNIEWHIPKTWWLNPRIQKHNFYLCHGDGIRGRTLVAVEKVESKVAGMLAQSLDYFLMGHFHSPGEIQTNSSRVIMNGSFMGGDMYSLKDLGQNCAAEQKVFGIHERKGITWTYNIYLDDA